MEIFVSQRQGRVTVTVFHVKGDMNTETYEQFQAQAQQVIQAGARYLALDLTEVSYVSSYGIRGISQVFTWLRDASQGGDPQALDRDLKDGTWKSPHLKLVNPSSQVRQVLTTTGVDMFLEIHSDLKHAIDSF